MNEDLEKNLNEINKLPGLKRVKEEVKNLLAFLQNSKDRKEQGLRRCNATNIPFNFFW